MLTVRCLRTKQSKSQAAARTEDKDNPTPTNLVVLEDDLDRSLELDVVVRSTE